MSGIAVGENISEAGKESATAINYQDRILSLSGGGVKGIAELVVLAEIEERTGKSISELFPIITGTRECWRSCCRSADHTKGVWQQRA